MFKYWKKKKPAWLSEKFFSKDCSSWHLVNAKSTLVKPPIWRLFFSMLHGSSRYVRDRGKLRPIFWRETRKECENLDWLQVRVAQNMGRYFISQILITKLSWFTRINLIRISRIAVNHGSLRSISQTKLVHVIPSDPIDSPNWIQFGHSFTNVHRNYSM